GRRDVAGGDARATTLRFSPLPSRTTNTTLSSLLLGEPTGADGGGGIGARSPSGDGPGGAPDARTVTAWIGTPTTSRLVSVEIDTCALIPDSTCGGGWSRCTHTGNVVISFSVPAFLTMASRPLSMTVPLIGTSGRASTSTVASCPGFTNTTS